MAYCYRCGGRIPDDKPRYRRRVVVSHVSERRTGKQRSTIARTTQGYRIICGHCAIALDAQDLRADRLAWVQIGVGLALAAVLWIINRGF